MCRKRLFCIAIIVILLGTNAIAQLPGDLDSTWSGNGKVYTSILNHDCWAEDIAQQADEKIVVVGGYFDGYWDFSAVRYNGDGTLDSTFGTDGIVTTDFGDPGGCANALAIQDDQKIVVVGYYVSGPSLDSIGGMNEDFVILRYLPNGALDSTFGINGIVCQDFGTDQDMANAVAIQTDGRIIVTGHRGNGSIKNCLTVRYLQNGVMDSTFGTNGYVTTSYSSLEPSGAVTIQADGKIVIAGGTIGLIIRYNSDGTPDPTFGTGGCVNSLGFYGGSKKVVVQSDGKIVYGGWATGSQSDDLAMSRVNSNGIIDNNFGTNGTVVNEVTIYNDWWKAHHIQDNGKIVMAGMAIPDSGIFYFSTVRFNTDGTIDSTYSDDGKTFTRVGKSDAITHSMEIQTDGKILVAGSVTLDGMTQICVIRYIGGEFSGIEYNNSRATFSMVPNPASGVVTINGDQPFDQVELYNVLGERVLNSTGGKRSLDLSFLQDGLYLIHVYLQGELIYRDKLIVY